MIMTAATLGAIVEAGANVLTLVEGLEQAEFERSRITRREVGRLLLVMAGALVGLEAAAQARLPEIDWPGWARVASELRQPAADAADTAWFAARAMVPATLMWLQVYRRAEPALFEYRP